METPHKPERWESAEWLAFLTPFVLSIFVLMLASVLNLCSIDSTLREIKGAQSVKQIEVSK